MIQNDIGIKFRDLLDYLKNILHVFTIPFFPSSLFSVIENVNRNYETESFIYFAIFYALETFETNSLGYSIPEGHFRMCRWTGYVFFESFSLRTQTYLRSSEVCVSRLWVFRIPIKNFFFFQNHLIPLCQFKQF